MIAKIGRSSNLYGALAYNLLKVEKQLGQILLTSRIIETASGQYSAAQLSKSFDLYLTANRNTEKPVLHISINPDPKDNVSDEGFRKLAEEYMKEMGYADQPFAVFKHTDIDRTHIHIVSVCVDQEGKKISDRFEKRRSMNICREMEKKYGLIPVAEKEHQQNDKIFHPVNYKKGDVKSQIASVVRYLPKHYKFQTLGEYNALLSLFNLTTEKIEGELHGKMLKGLLYIPLDENGEKTGHPLKASLFGKSAGLSAMELHFSKCSEAVKDEGAKVILKAAVTTAIESTNNEQDFKRQLAAQGINTVVRVNGQGRVYGITFIDHNSRTVFNGSRLGAAFAANAFNESWSNIKKSDIKEPVRSQFKLSKLNQTQHISPGEPHQLFDFLITDKPEGNVFEVFGGLLPEVLDEDFQEQDFAHRMKKKKRKPKRDQ